MFVWDYLFYNKDKVIKINNINVRGQKIVLNLYILNLYSVLIKLYFYINYTNIYTYVVPPAGLKNRSHYFLAFGVKYLFC